MLTVYWWKVNIIVLVFVYGFMLFQRIKGFSMSNKIKKKPIYDRRKKCLSWKSIQRKSTWFNQLTQNYNEIWLLEEQTMIMNQCVAEYNWTSLLCKCNTKIINYKININVGTRDPPDNKISFHKYKHFHQNLNKFFFPWISLWIFWIKHFSLFFVNYNNNTITAEIIEQTLVMM